MNFQKHPLFKLLKVFFGAIIRPLFEYRLDEKMDGKFTSKL